MIKIEGDLGEELVKEGWVACEITECPRCDGSGWSEFGYAAEGKPGDRFYGEAVEGVTCGCCEGSGYILDLDTAIACKVTTKVEIG